MTSFTAYALSATKDAAGVPEQLISILGVLVPVFPSEDAITSSLAETSEAGNRTFVKITVETIDDLDPDNAKRDAATAAEQAEQANVDGDNLTVDGAFDPNDLPSADEDEDDEDDCGDDDEFPADDTDDGFYDYDEDAEDRKNGRE